MAEVGQGDKQKFERDRWLGWVPVKLQCQCDKTRFVLEHAMLNVAITLTLEVNLERWGGASQSMIDLHWEGSAI